MPAVRLAPARNLALVLFAGASLAACATHPTLSNRLPQDRTAGVGKLPSGAGGVYKVGKPYQVGGIWYVPREEPNYNETGLASWYGDEFHNKPTANGETFDMHAVSAAHTTLPLPSMVEVTNLENGRRLQVRVNDRGPFVGGRLIDLSHEAARELGYDAKGLAQVRVRYLGPAPLGVGEGVRYAKAGPAPTAPVAPSYPPAAPYAPGPVVAAAGPVSSQALPPLVQPRTTPPAAPIITAQRPAPMSGGFQTVSNTPGAFRVQAGAFSDAANAQRAVQDLSSAAPAVIETFDRDGETLYRVMLQGGSDEIEAWAVRDRIAALGFEDARVVRAF